VKTLEEARIVVDKNIHYSTPPGSAALFGNCSGTNQSVFGDWRNMLCFVADDEDNNLHVSQADEVAQKIVDTLHKEYNIDKIYLDAFKQISTPGGQRYPDANDAINKRVERGALVISYVGHGGELGGWSIRY
jgi:hypothetical protein